MNRDVLAALLRAAVTLLAGAALLAAAGRLLGWWSVAAIGVAACGDAIWSWARMPARWRPW